jgi:UDP-2,3-diacylglucosamine diphosphatase
MTTLFVSDLHLHASRPAVTACFLRFLSHTASQARALYILGDLFESWIGDDAPGQTGIEVSAALRSLADRGVACSFMQGNRDFLISRHFAVRSGLTLLPDETVIDLHGERALLMHGDTLCTDDHAYQRRHAGAISRSAGQGQKLRRGTAAESQHGDLRQQTRHAHGREPASSERSHGTSRSLAPGPWTYAPAGDPPV